MYNEKITNRIYQVLIDDVSNNSNINESMWGIFEKGILEYIILEEIKILFSTSKKDEDIIKGIDQIFSYEKSLKYDWYFERKLLTSRFSNYVMK